MSNTYIQDGKTMPFVATADTASGAVVVAGDRIGVSLTTVPDTEAGTLSMTGVHNLPKKAADAFLAGAVVYWDAALGHCTSTVGTNTVAGYAHGPAVATTTAMHVAINA